MMRRSMCGANIVLASLALGAGVLDWDRYLSLLGAAKFAGPLIMHGFEEKDVATSVKFLREKLAASREN